MEARITNKFRTCFKGKYSFTYYELLQEYLKHKAIKETEKRANSEKVEETVCVKTRYSNVSKAQDPSKDK